MEFNNSIHERLPIITNTAHCARALAFAESKDIFFAIGKQDPWGSNENDTDFIPPEPDVNATNLDGLIGMKRAERVSLVIPDESGEFEYQKIKFKTLTNEEAFKRKARWVLIETTIFYDELPPLPYRQIGVFSRVKPVAGKELSNVLLPEDIEDVGILEVLNNRKAVTRQSDTKDTYFMVIEC